MFNQNADFWLARRLPSPTHIGPALAARHPYSMRASLRKQIAL